jgi:surface antigen
MQTPNSAGGLGHVAYVTAVDPTSGVWTISEMNVKGLDIVDVTTYPASAAQNYNFIHDKEPTNSG